MAAVVAQVNCPNVPDQKKFSVTVSVADEILAAEEFTSQVAALHFAQHKARLYRAAEQILVGSSQPTGEMVGRTQLYKFGDVIAWGRDAPDGDWLQLPNSAIRFGWRKGP